ncbi:phosphotransferase [Kitasatospora sp. RB6PN24]|uniref:phosphotransferase n=1 Tax=Kitasatospora humi TaxID=2893891 RepID=UPI001E65D084|nr:phosphotransferase [Kitasatospora humi]MCC9305888.1 phosphotransferase [Kitasatospora humi]
MTDRRHLAVTAARPPGGWTDDAALSAVVDALGLTIEYEILEGGSPARVYRAGTSAGADLAVKVLVPAAGAVDGHDLASFRRKLRQIDRLQALAPDLAAHYLPVRHVLDGDGWSAATTPFYDSADLAAPLRRSPHGTREFFRQYAAVIRTLVLHGYAAQSHPTPAGHVAQVVVGRFLRRLPVLHRALPAELMTAERLTVNGVRCQAPHLVLERLAGRLAPLAPARLMAPAHGDFNTRNVLVSARPGAAVDDFRFIDPRGSTEPWDPVYDLAKTLFSLSVWDPALRTGFSVRSSRRHGYQVGFRQPVFPGYRAAIHRFLPRLAACQGLSEVFRDDPGWLERLLLTHDLHVLAEAPCRLSDRKPKPDLRGGFSTPAELALGHYLLGTLLINDLAAQLGSTGRVDAERHLALVADHLPHG